MSSRYPNILLIHSDQHRYDCLGCNGHPLVKTPNLDRLAEGGVRFTHTFTPNPVCSPARACLQTGTWATSHGCITIPGTEAFRPADDTLPVVSELLHQAGYRLGHVGKYHQELVGTPHDHGVEDYVNPYGYHAWRDTVGLPPLPREHGLFGEADHTTPPHQSALAWQADHVVGLLNSYAEDDMPFFLRWDPSEPHLPNIVPEPYASLYQPEDIAPWPSFPDSLEGKPEAQHRTRRRWGTEGWVWEPWSEIVARYLGEITLLDEQIGRLLDQLDALGQSSNTLVIYTSDHGDMCGGHGMMDKHYVMYEDIMRVPLIMQWPDTLTAGATCDAMVIHEIDIARTLLTSAGVEVPESFVGLSLFDQIDNSTCRSDVFAQYQGTHQGLCSQRMLRDRRYKYIYNPVSIDELYDLEDDPGELINLANVPEHVDRLGRMQERMSQWMVDIKDPLSSPRFAWHRDKLPLSHPASSSINGT